MKKMFIIFSMFFICISSFSQVWSDNFNGIDSLWNISAPTIVNPIVMKDMYNFNDSILFPEFRTGTPNLKIK